MFVARSQELSQLAGAMKQSNHAALVYGKRRVGKTRLIKEALKQQRQSVIYYECIKGQNGMKQTPSSPLRLLEEVR